MKETSSKRISPIYIFGLINFQKPLVELTLLYEDEFSFTFIFIHVCHERLCNWPRFDRGLRKLRIGLFLGEIFLGFLNFLSIIVPQSDGNLAPAIIDRYFQNFSVSRAQKHCYIESILIYKYYTTLEQCNSALPRFPRPPGSLGSKTWPRICHLPKDC